MNQIHIPVLLEATLELLAPKKGDTYLDMTAGYGGHAGAILAVTGNPSGATLVDRDERAIQTLRANFQDAGAQILQTDFGAAAARFAGEGKQFDMVLADLGLSSLHLDESSRGFSIKADGPLDMRMDQRQALTAEQVVNEYSEQELAEIFFRYGEEPRAKRIAQAIVAARPVYTTGELAEIVKRAAPGKRSLHPATTIFQAIRIVVNDELAQLEKLLAVLPHIVAPGGRVGIISFHSLEDRLVKQRFAEIAGERFDAEFRVVNKKPASASSNELVLNPRSRSAKLRVAVKIKT